MAIEKDKIMKLSKYCEEHSCKWCYCEEICCQTRKRMGSMIFAQMTDQELDDTYNLVFDVEPCECKKLYTWSQLNDNWENTDTFETIEDCIEDAKATIGQYIDIKDRYTIYVGECVEPTLFADFDDVLEDIADQAENDYGEVAEDWDICYDDSRKEIYDKYEKMLNILVKEYINEIGENPTFFKVENVKKIVIKEGDDQDGTND